MGLFGGNKTNSSGSLYAEFKAENAPVEYTATSGKVGRSAKEDIVVTSVVPGCGCTYISAAIANYLADINRGRVALVGDSKDTYVKPLLRTQILQKEYPVDIQDVYSICDCVVQDIGCYENIDEVKGLSLARASTKIIVCHADDDCMRQLAAFAKERPDADRFYYLFNVLPEEWKKKVYRTMNIYEAYCLPLFSVKAPDKETSLVLRKIFGR